MSKWKRRLSITVGALVGALVMLAAVTWMLVRDTPDWYQPKLMTTEQRDEAAQRATNKLALMQNSAAMARAEEHLAVTQSGSGMQSAPEAITISFSDDEINAFFQKWSVWQGVRASYDQYIVDPFIDIQDGRIILAGKLKLVDTVASLHFEPRVNPQGQLDLKLVRVLVGKLPVPRKLLTEYQQQATDGLRRRIPLWRKFAGIDPTGVANNNTISAVMGQLLINVLEDRPSEPLLFLPMVEHGCIPVHVADVKLQDHIITLVVFPMTPVERGALLERIRADDQPQNPHP